MSPSDATSQLDNAAMLERARVRAIAGEPGAMDDLLALAQPLVLRRCAKFLPHHADAEEAAQDALLAIATKLGSFSGQGSFAGWVSVVAANAARQTYRSLKRRAGDAPLELSAERPDPVRTSVVAGSRVDLTEALEAMEADKPHLVESFLLRDVAALPYDEIAQITGVPLGTTKARIHDARSYLREKLSEKM